MDLPSSDPVDLSFSNEDVVSTTKFYAWNFLEGSGRRDSNVDDGWVFNNAELGFDLMQFRERVIQENGGLTQSHEKLQNHQTRGLQAEVEDESWNAICEATRDRIDALPDVTIVEAHRWAHLLVNEKQESFRRRLDELSPKDPTLKAILNKQASIGQLWGDQLCNEDTYLKSRLKTRDSDSDQLVPDFATMTVASKRQLSVVLLEGKVHSNRASQFWDDKIKLGQELKLGLDSILMLLPEDDVSVIGILVREPVVEFFTMKIQSEATYIMRRFALCYVAGDCMNMFPMTHLMEAFQHVQKEVGRTVAAIRRVKVRPSTSPKIPLSWLRPSFRKLRLLLVPDGD
ncbi:hypothetical protein BGZ95_004397 [Linnemannia exigua]|uniref:Uncharacterized protein n=1 Tax=Linnemannia exigua TaxID=604196 RepID=A0AAD4D329_9FUNG|nr:hypothetical protein BGZ95_004397 [Linnemannia exigua]